MVHFGNRNDSGALVRSGQNSTSMNALIPSMKATDGAFMHFLFGRDSRTPFSKSEVIPASQCLRCSPPSCGCCKDHIAAALSLDILIVKTNALRADSEGPRLLQVGIMHVRRPSIPKAAMFTKAVQYVSACLHRE